VLTECIEQVSSEGTVWCIIRQRIPLHGEPNISGLQGLQELTRRHTTISLMRMDTYWCVRCVSHADFSLHRLKNQLFTG
jgi:hypothetical protein